MRLVSLPVIAMFIAALSFASLTQASGHKDKFHNGKGPHHERHYDGNNQQPFRELKREKMQRYRNNEMVHGCIEAAQSKRDIGRCIKEHKKDRKAQREYEREDRKSYREQMREDKKAEREYLREDMQKYREQQREQRQSEREERHEYLRSLSPEEREAKRQEYRQKNREYRENYRDERREYYKNRRDDDDS